MSALFSPTSFLSSSTPHFLNPNPNPNPTPRFFLFPSRTARSFKISANLDPDNKSSAPPPPPPLEKRSFGVATGEFFLGIAALFLKKNNASQVRISGFTKAFTEDVDVDGAESKFLRPRERIASVSEGVIWEQRLKDVEAEKSRKNVTSPGFSFSAAGLLMPYHLGAAQYLIEKGYIKESTPLAGSSAGAIVCAIIASGVSMQIGLQATKVLAEDCRLKGTAFRLGAVLKEVLGQFLPDDIHYKSNGRIRVAVTQLFWRPRALLVDQFDSKEDLINALFTSSFIPGYLAPTPATLFRNRLCIDGGLTLFMPPTSASNTVRVCAFPASRLGLSGIGISPDCNPDNRATPRQLFNWALEPAEDDVLDNLFELGYLDAAVWGDLNPVDEIVQDESVQDESMQDESVQDESMQDKSLK